MREYFGYQNKLCVITGAASGIGHSTAKILADLGANIYAVDKNPINLKGVSKTFCTDLSQKESIDELFEKLPKQFDCFFGCAGVSGMQNTFNETFTINYISPSYVLNQQLNTHISPGGSIAFVTSAAGVRWEDYRNSLDNMILLKNWKEKETLLKHWNYNKIPGVMAYSLSSRAMNQHIAYYLPFFSKKGIRVNALLPSCTETGLKSEFEKAVGSPEKFLDYAGLSKRLAKPYEMAKPLVFLNSKMASFMTGNELIVDYGNDSLIKAGLKRDTYYQSNFYFRNWMVRGGLHFAKDRFHTDQKSR